MLQGIRASTLTMPSFGHDMSMAGPQRFEGYGDTDPWSWPQPAAAQQPSYSTVFDPSAYANFTPQLQAPSRGPTPHHSITNSHALVTGTSTPPPSRPQVSGTVVKAQPAFKPTWHGFLDTTKDAMTIIEASLQGRLNHISRRPHDKERAEMLTSGTVLVYEENASGIKRWTDAVHWSPSRVMNNCLIYRQLVRALKPEEKKTALNPSCGTKRKRKESTGPTITKTGENINNSDDEYENPSYDASMPGDVEMTKVYANFAQTLTPDQQRRYCGSLIDSYEFKEGGLMKKTISVKYRDTHHHVISYYSLEDVVSGKLKRPCHDAKLADVLPRPELLNGWKVNLEDEESKDLPLVANYPSHLQASHLLHHVIGSVPQPVSAQPAMPTHTPLHLHIPEYWHGSPVSQYTPSHPSPQTYSTQSAGPQYSPPQSAHRFHAQQPSPTIYTPQLPPAPHFAHTPSPDHFPSPVSAGRQFPAPEISTQPYAHQPQTAPLYPQVTSSHYPPTHADQPTSAAQFTVPQSATFDIHVLVPQSLPAVQQSSLISAPGQDAQRRASAPVNLQNYGSAQYPTAPFHPSYFVADTKYLPEQKHTPDSHHGY